MGHGHRHTDVDNEVNKMFKMFNLPWHWNPCLPKPLLC